MVSECANELHMRLYHCLMWLYDVRVYARTHMNERVVIFCHTDIIIGDDVADIGVVVISASTAKRAEQYSFSLN